jgi:hypothetical protein
VQLSEVGNVDLGLSSLAAGTDQTFAEVALGMGTRILAVIPVAGYERFFGRNDLLNYRRLLNRCEVVELNLTGEPQRSFFEAGKYIVDNCDVLFAVWDGAASEGLGGTADVVAYAKHRRRKIIHINPMIKRTTRV